MLRATRRATEEVPAFLRTITAYAKALLAINSEGKEEGRGESPRLVAELEAAAAEIVHDEKAFQVPQNHVFFPNHQEMGKIMVLMAQAAIAVKVESRVDKAVELLDEAVVLQDSFKYMEPEHYYTPVRHCLGAALLAHYKQLQASSSSSSSSEGGREVLQQAERVYRRDLLDHPHNVWAYTGLHETLSLLSDGAAGSASQGAQGRLSEVKEEMSYVLETATFVPTGSCCELGLC